jgi:hypothetical protein
MNLGENANWTTKVTPGLHRDGIAAAIKPDLSGIGIFCVVDLNQFSSALSSVSSSERPVVISSFLC